MAKRVKKKTVYNLVVDACRQHETTTWDMLQLNLTSLSQWCWSASGKHFHLRALASRWRVLTCCLTVTGLITTYSSPPSDRIRFFLLPFKPFFHTYTHLSPSRQIYIALTTVWNSYVVRKPSAGWSVHMHAAHRNTNGWTDVQFPSTILRNTKLSGLKKRVGDVSKTATDLSQNNIDYVAYNSLGTTALNWFQQEWTSLIPCISRTCRLIGWCRSSLQYWRGQLVHISWAIGCWMRGMVWGVRHVVLNGEKPSRFPRGCCCTLARLNSR